jgi:uncharacterized protein (TIGR03435 family)
MPPNKRPIISTVLGIAFAVSITFAHAQSARPTFEVATIELSPNQSLGRVGMIYSVPEGRLTASAILLRVLIFTAYGTTNDYELIGGPEWISTARWDVEARWEGNRSNEQIKSMLQSLLEDRFNLVRCLRIPAR